MRINVARSSMPGFEEYCEEIRVLWDSRWLTNNGVKALALEAALGEYLDIPHVVLFSNGHLALEAAIRNYIAENNAHPRPFVWTKTADEILTKANCSTTSNTAH